MLGVLHKYNQPLQFSLFFFRADDPPAACSSIPGSLRPEELPCGFVCTKLLLICSGKFGAFSLLVRVDRRPLFFALLKSSETGDMHQSELGKLGSSSYIDGAPDATRLAWCESNLVANRVYALANTIDPTEAERAVHSFRPGYAGAPGIPLVEANPELCRLGVMFFEPGSPHFERKEKERLHLPNRHHAEIVSEPVTSAIARLHPQ
jgi:hypothetical protein